MARAVAFAGLSILGVLAVGPVLAGPAEVALLESYVGSWSGRGTLVAQDRETVVCRLAIKKGNDNKINLSGKCGMAGTQVGVTGTIAYVDANRRFEAAMRMSSFSGTAAGQRQGDSIVFDLKERNKDDKGNDLTIDADMSIGPSSIDVRFEVVFAANGRSISATIPFTKS
jgi:hypothetical protein